MRTVLNVQQGTPEWAAARAASDGTASEYPAAAGKSKHQNRTDLMQQRKTGIIKEVDIGLQILFDRGHAAEALARPMAESIMGAELSPTTIILEIDGLKLLASLDGITFDDETIFEHKLFNASLADAVRSGTLDEHYTLQMDQELLVSGAKSCLFMTSDDTEQNCEWMWYETTEENKQAVIATWQQFHKDMAEFTPRIIADKPHAEAMIALSALTIQSEGAIAIKSNLNVFGQQLQAFVAKIDMEPNDDQGFSNAEEAVKVMQRAEDALDNAESNALAMAPSVDEMRRTVAMLKDVARKTRLALEKIVKTRKEQIKVQIMSDAYAKYQTRLSELEAEIKPIRIISEINNSVFAEAAKNKRTLASLHDAIDTVLSQSIMAIDKIASDIRAKLSWYKDNADGYGFLFSDLQIIIHQTEEAFRIIVQGRIEQHKKSEEERDKKIREEAEKKALETVEQVKIAVELKQDQPSDLNQVEAAQQVKVVDLQAAIIEKQEEIRAFLASRNFGKEEPRVRSILIEFVKFQTIFNRN